MAQGARRGGDVTLEHAATVFEIIAVVLGIALVVALAWEFRK